MIFLYIYCGLCWLIMAYFLWGAFRQFRAIEGAKDKLAWWNLSDAVRGFIYAPAFLPINVLLALFWYVWEWRDRMIQRQLRKYREYLFEPVEPGELPAHVAAFFQKHTEPLINLRFRRIDDYWLTLNVGPPET